MDEESVKRPDPIGGFAFTKIDCNRALMFGGLGVNGRVNEARIFDFEERVRMNWDIESCNSVHTLTHHLHRNGVNQ